MAVIAAAGLVSLATPAFADDKVEVQLLSSSFDLQANAEDILTVRVTNKQATPDTFVVTVSVPSALSGSLAVSRSGCTNGIQSKCTGVAVPANNGHVDLDFKLKANASVPAGQTQSGNNGNVQASSFAGNDSKSFSAIVRGPAASATISEISGEVVNVFDATPVANAVVFLQDSDPKNWEVATDKNGRFKFTSTPDKPITAGTLALRVEKDGWETATKPVVAQPGQPVPNQHLTMRPLNVTAGPTVSGGAQPTQSLAAIDSGAPPTSAANEKEGGLSWMLIAAGGVLVLLGLGAIALLFLRRRGEDDDDDDDRPTPRKVPGRVPPSRGGVRPGAAPGGPGGPGGPPRRVPEKTAVMRGGPPDPRRQGPAPGRPVSPGPRGDHTVVSRSPLADQPTMMHGRLPNEHADPYTTPGRYNNGSPGAAPGGGYPPSAPSGGGYGGTPTSGYAGGAGAGHGYGQPADPYAQPGPQPGPYDAYGQPGYGQQQPPPGYDPRAGRSGQPPADRRLDWLDD